MIQDWLKRLRTFWSANRRNQIIVAASCAVVLVLLVSSIALLANRGGASANGIAQATATPLPQTASTSGPSPTAGPTGTPLPTSPVNRAVVGGTEAAFTAVYGKPTSTGVDSGNNLPTVTTMGAAPSAASPSNWIARRAMWLAWSSARRRMRRSTRPTYSQ